MYIHTTYMRWFLAQAAGPYDLKRMSLCLFASEANRRFRLSTHSQGPQSSQGAGTLFFTAKWAQRGEKSFLTSPRCCIRDLEPFGWLETMDGRRPEWMTLTDFLADCTPKVVSLDTSGPSATLAPTPPSFRLRVSLPRRMPSSTSERCVQLVAEIVLRTDLL